MSDLEVYMKNKEGKPEKLDLDKLFEDMASELKDNPEQLTHLLTSLILKHSKNAADAFGILEVTRLKIIDYVMREAHRNRTNDELNKKTPYHWGGVA